MIFLLFRSPGSHTQPEHAALGDVQFVRGYKINLDPGLEEKGGKMAKGGQAEREEGEEEE
jgi:hypothetical protein